MRFKKIFAMLLTGIMTVSVPGAVFAASTEEQIADVQAQKEAAQAELAQQQSDMASLESKKQELESYLEELNAQYTDLTNSVSELGIQAAEKEEELKTLNTQLEEAKATADKQYQDMKKRIVYMYENGSASMLELLLSSEDLAQFLNRAENIAQISQYDRDMLNKMKKTKEKIASAKSTLVTEKKNLQTIHAQQKSDQTKLTNLSASKQQELKNYEDLIAHNEATSDELEAEISAQEKRVASAEEQSKNQAAAEQARREAAAKKQQAASSNSSTSNTSSNTGSNTTDTSNSGNSGSSGTVSGGGFTWPLPGHTTISSGYGYRGSEFHKGIDIPASAGTTIVAAGSGTVEWANYSTTAGNWIGINHGNGVYSVYMHMSALLVSAGTKVSAGQSIGLVGNTGASQGNHLHFAVRKNGAYVNPWDYLK